MASQTVPAVTFGQAGNDSLLGKAAATQSDLPAILGMYQRPLRS